MVAFINYNPSHTHRTSQEGDQGFSHALSRILYGSELRSFPTTLHLSEFSHLDRLAAPLFTGDSTMDGHGYTHLSLESQVQILMLLRGGDSGTQKIDLAQTYSISSDASPIWALSAPTSERSSCSPSPKNIFFNAKSRSQLSSERLRTCSGRATVRPIGSSQSCAGRSDTSEDREESENSDTNEQASNETLIFTRYALSMLLRHVIKSGT